MPRAPGRTGRTGEVEAPATRIRFVLDAFLADLAASHPGPALPEHVGQALTCIHRHLFDERLNVAFVRDACGLHNHNLSIRFKRAVGLGMSRYIEAHRLEAARRLLVHDSVPISDIAWAVGYTYIESFERAFQRRFGCAPTQFREKTKG